MEKKKSKRFISFLRFLKDNPVISLKHEIRMATSKTMEAFWGIVDGSKICSLLESVQAFKLSLMAILITVGIKSCKETLRS